MVRVFSPGYGVAARLRVASKLIVYRIPCDFVFPPATSWMETPRRVLGERVPVQRPAPTHMPAKTRGGSTPSWPAPVERHLAPVERHLHLPLELLCWLVQALVAWRADKSRLPGRMANECGSCYCVLMTPRATVGWLPSSLSTLTWTHHSHHPSRSPQPNNTAHARPH